MAVYVCIICIYICIYYILGALYGEYRHWYKPYDTTSHFHSGKTSYQRYHTCVMLAHHQIIRGYHMGGSVIWFVSNEWWCDITNERGTSEWVISHQHEFDKIISQCHPCDYLFMIYHNTRTNRNFVHTYHGPYHSHI